MPWHPSLNRLRDVLAELYPTAAQMRRAARSATLPLARVTLRGDPVSDWQTSWKRHSGRIISRTSSRSLWLSTRATARS